MGLGARMSLVALFLSLGFSACGSSTSEGEQASLPASQENVGAAIGSIFGGSGETANLTKKSAVPYRLVSLLVRQARAQMESFSACDMLDTMPEDDVVVSGTIAAGTYGRTPDDTVTLTEDEDCDSGGEYASFVVTSHSMTCTNGETGDETTMTMDSGAGVWRENQETNATEIYGTFNISSGEDSVTDLLCSFTISHDQEGGGVFSGGCVDAEGVEVEQSEDVTCTDTDE